MNFQGRLEELIEKVGKDFPDDKIELVKLPENPISPEENDFLWAFRINDYRPRIRFVGQSEIDRERDPEEVTDPLIQELEIELRVALLTPKIGIEAARNKYKR